MKPIYRLPSMKEISEINHNGFNVVSTFSGAGGSCLGYRMAGYKVLYANEFIPAAQETYKENHPNSYLDTRDIRQVKAEDILKITGLNVGEIDIFDGSPPCASFSTAGKREKGWNEVREYSDTKQRVDDLFFEYARLLKELQPKVFIAENVSGLIKGTAKGYFKLIMKEFKQSGYTVKAALLNAKWLGVPQSRERLIFIGVRNDLGLKPVFPNPKNYYYALEDALNGLNVKLEPETEIKNKTLEIIKKLKPGQSGTDVMGKNSYFSLKRLEWNKPVGTVQQSEATMASTNQVHPTENRRLGIQELKRVSSFPDDFILTGTFAQQWERIGRAVPPIMMKEISKTVEREILCKIV